jgi:hypothetical protein
MHCDPTLQRDVEFLAIYVCHPNHVHNYAYDPKIVQYEDLRIALSKMHSSCLIRIMIIILNVFHIPPHCEDFLI